MASQPIDNGVQDAGGNDNDAPQMTEVEQIAHDKGWRPRDQFKGSDDEWRPAADFLRKMPGTRDLKREVSDMRRAIEGIERASKLSFDRELKAEKEKIEARFAEAVENKDKGAAAEAARDMRALERDQRDDSPEQRFADENAWYGKDEDATTYAISVSQREAKRGATVEQQLKAAREAVEKRFPELVSGDDEPPKPKPKTLTLNAPGRTVDRPSGKSYADMPTAAKAAADRFYEAAKMRGNAPDRDKFNTNYAKDYFDNA